MEGGMRRWGRYESTTRAADGVKTGGGQQRNRKTKAEGTGWQTWKARKKSRGKVRGWRYLLRERGYGT